MIYASGYPIYHTLDATDGTTITYRITLAGEDIFTGRILPYDSTLTEVRVDLSEVFREFLEPAYENLPLSDTFYGSLPDTIQTFTVISDYNVPETGEIGDPVTYKVAYNYNTEYISELPDLDTINAPLITDIDPRQYVSISGYNTTGPGTYRYRVNGGTWTSRNITSDTFQIFGLKPESLEVELAEGDTVEFQQVKTGRSFIYTVATPCRNRFVLYYVNKAGGLDWLLCSGQSVESFSPDRVDIRLYDDRLNRRDWQAKRLYQEIENSYELNTRLLTDEQARRIDELIYSNRVWIHDLEKDTITSCLITDSNYTVRNHDNDDMFSYTINVKESQKYIRK